MIKYYSSYTRCLFFFYILCSNLFLFYALLGIHGPLLWFLHSFVICSYNSWLTFDMMKDLISMAYGQNVVTLKNPKNWILTTLYWKPQAHKTNCRINNRQYHPVFCSFLLSKWNIIYLYVTFIFSDLLLLLSSMDV